MSVAEAERALGGAVNILDDTAECEYISPPGWPAGVSFMIVDGRVVRVDVRAGRVATAGGVRIGSTEAEVYGLYPGQVEVRPHKYTAGHYLIVTPAGPDAMRLRIVFETNGELVERFRAGLLPEVEWVEGCS